MAKNSRRAKLVAEAVLVICPGCGEPVPNRDSGSHLWDHQQVVNATDAVPCLCGESVFVRLPKMVAF